MKLWYGSDMHSDFWKQDNHKKHIDRDAFDGFILAGDTGEWLMRRGNGMAIINWLLQTGKPVIYVAGNHEFYSGNYDLVQDDLYAFSQDNEHFHYLQSSYLDLPELKKRIWGDTLWTNFQNSQECRSVARRQMNDYKHIFQNAGFGNVFLTPEMTVEFNRLALESLRKSFVSMPEGYDMIVVSHHAPTFMSIGKAYRKPSYTETAKINAAYANALDDWLVENRVRPLVWIHGHIHERANYYLDIDDVMMHVVSNPYGYPGEKPVEDFGKHYIEILEDRIVVV